MKKLLFILFSLLISGSIFAQTFKFEGKKYQMEFVDEFDDDIISGWKNLHTSYGKVGQPHYKKYEVTDEDGRKTITGKTLGKKDRAFLIESDENNYVKDGVFYMKTSTNREKNELGGYDYSFDSNFTWLPETNIRKGTYVEVKFRVPKAPGFDFTFFAVDPTTWGYSQLNKPNEKGWIISELDFIEFPSAKNNNFRYMRPRPCVNAVDIKGKRFDDWTNRSILNILDIQDVNFKVNDSWFEEWHVLQAVVSEDGMSFTTYFDGKKVETMKFPGLGSIGDKDMRLVLISDNRPLNWENSHDYSKYNEYLFEVDYIKVAQPVK